MDVDGGVPAEVLDAYGAGEATITPLSGGRTNRTLRVVAGRPGSGDTSRGGDLVLQQLRSISGSDLLGIMENLVRVAAHLDWKHHVAQMEGDGPNHSGRSSQTWWPELVPTGASKPYLFDADGRLWRAFRYRSGRIGRPILPLDSLASAAALFGRFSNATADLGGPDLVETSPGFHDLDVIWSSFETTLDAASPESAAPVRDHLDEIEAVRGRLDARVIDDGLDDLIPRVVHNDTKISNVLLHDTSADAIAVLDLDLAMMGPIWHDVGDLVRSIAWHLDDAGPTMVDHVFETVCAAFVRGAGETVSDAEIATFAVAGPRLAFELGTRYLTGHLDPANALRVEGDLGRLHRGMANVNLAAEMLNAYDALRYVVDDLTTRR
ncbi:MAG: aminoglycoside phosphotransferase family protein [Actinomycetota bacterium]